MKAVDEYLNQVLTQVNSLPPTVMPVAEALGATLAEDVFARFPVPPFTNSAMDGFAVRSCDLPNVLENTSTPAATGAEKSATTVPAATPSQSELPSAPGDDGAKKTLPLTLPVEADIAAGDNGDYQLSPGHAIRIMTGARMPAGADTVIKVEDTTLPAGPLDLPKEVTIERCPRAGANVRKAGEDAAVGDLVLAAGTVLTPAALSSAVSIGYSELPVYRRPRVAVISTGLELRPAGASLKGAQIPDSNSVLLEALLRRQDVIVSGVYSSDDEPEVFAKTLEQAAQGADLIVTTGGVSAGAYDVVKQVGLSGGLAFTKVAMQPGKPQGFGSIAAPDGADVYVATLPGNPVSVFVSFHVFVRPVLAALSGKEGRAALQTRAATTTVAWKSPAGKRQFVPVHLTEAERVGDTPTVTPTHRLGARSHFVASLHQANALAIVPEEVTEVEQWSLIDVLPC
ncbi:molybdopterin molybdotransferase MoeA [Varibaculum cambriense]|uniref:Molybdopterin molybdenumtransferase n=1 Tax=Varibaculum cambriense TaxID=184870 RepID=A0AB34WX32_9ACTO|nr:gephyrin-like molybdotransferase Glp [Varibaculum cambriense]KXB79299.1 molybdenum cofactor synthesis domain protein [Varibaculum cambriense]PMB89509.1 molybdopterin molybdenumtransferase MoeA [Varibaculum cambriense]